MASLPVLYKQVKLDLDGHLTPKLWLYIVPHSTHEMILGKRWLEDQDAIIHSKEQRLELKRSGGSIYSINLWRHKLRNVARPKVTTIEVISEMIKTVPVCKASIEDISKALRPKQMVTMEDVKSRLPEEIKDFAHLFTDYDGAQKLPPLRGHLDHAINLRQENGKPLTPPWGPLYGMSREELLVQRPPLYFLPGNRTEACVFVWTIED